MSNHSTKLSFELFPPNSWRGLQNLTHTCDELNTLNPSYFSLTFGAAGATQEKTVHLAKNLAHRYKVLVPHLSCVNMTKEKLLNLLDDYKNHGIDRLLVIRGDFTKETETLPRDFNYANELITFIREKTSDYFHITVAAYPEFHPEAKSSHDDFLNFKRKIDAGANSAVTQFFFNTDAYFRFIDECHRRGISVPITPGIMPIIDYNRLTRFAGLCGAEIPLWLRKQLDRFSNDSDSIKEFGIEIVTKLCETLLRQGVNSFHFYTLNQVEPVKQICEDLLIKEPFQSLAA